MAFTVEDGTGLAAANAYISTAFANAYHKDRGHDTWAGSQTEKQQAIIRATDYVEKRFGRRFRGTRQSQAQALEWPRFDAEDNDQWLFNGSDDIPRQLENAIAEYALRALVLITGTDADLVPDGSSGAGDVRSESVKVGPITESKTYATSHTRSSQSSIVGDGVIPEYPAADLWLEELLRSSSVTRVRRA